MKMLTLALVSSGPTTPEWKRFLIWIILIMSRFQNRSLIRKQHKSAFVSRSTKEHATDVQGKQISFYILNCCCQLRNTELESHLKKQIWLCAEGCDQRPALRQSVNNSMDVQNNQISSHLMLIWFLELSLCWQCFPRCKDSLIRGGAGATNSMAAKREGH